MLSSVSIFLNCEITVSLCLVEMAVLLYTLSFIGGVLF